MKQRMGADVGRMLAVCGELQPYRWQSWTPETLARRVVAGLDRRAVDELVAEMPGLRGSGSGHLHPAEVSDERVQVLLAFLYAHLWRGLTLPRLVGCLLGALDAWWIRRQCFETELNWLVSGDQ